MMDLNLDKYAMKNIATLGLPVYICGTVKANLGRLLSYFDAHGIQCAGFFEVGPTPRFHLDIPTSPPPNDPTALPAAVIICAAELCDQKKWMEHFSRDGVHTVFDINDLFDYPSWVTCNTHFVQSANLLQRCKACPAARRDCPVRAQYYARKGSTRTRAIERLLLRCGFLCNYNCEGCSQFLPYFTDQKRNFDGSEVIADLKKMAASLQYIQDLWLEGGEAMLWKPFPEVLRAAAALDNINNISILTNGSYLPAPQVLDALAENRERVRIEINAYEANHQLNRLFDTLDARGIPFILRSGIGNWVDFRDTHHSGIEQAQLCAVKESCSFFKRDFDLWILTDGKLSAMCCMAGYLTHYLDLYGQCANDYIDIRSPDTGDLPKAMERLYARGFMDACNYCAGARAGGQHINVAKQLN